MPPTPTISEGSKAPTPRLHLAYLDGLRGLAALYVVVYHLTKEYYQQPLSSWQHYALSWLQFGGWAVDVFIVLSGYCLMLPLAREEGSPIEQRQFLRRFFARRVRRIAPSYYAALLLSLLLSGFSWERGWVGITTSKGDLLTHALLIHNWFPRYAISLNPVMWTIATEWQIYFAFALLLLPLWRHGAVVLLAFSVLVGYLPMAFFSWEEVVYFRPWYLVLFAMGMVGAAITTSSRSEYRQLKNQNWWPAGLLFFMLGTALIHNFISSRYVAVDPFIGATTACFLVMLARGQGAALRRFLSCQLCVLLGSFSYSLYLVHSPCTEQLETGLLRFFPQLHWPLLVKFGLVLPLTLLLAFVFSLLFEQPFLSKHRLQPEFQRGE